MPEPNIYLFILLTRGKHHRHIKLRAILTQIYFRRWRIVPCPFVFVFLYFFAVWSYETDTCVYLPRHTKYMLGIEQFTSVFPKERTMEYPVRTSNQQHFDHWLGALTN